MTENNTASKKHAPKAAAAFTLSGLLIAGSTVPAAAALADDNGADTASINPTQIERLGETYVVSNDYLVVTHSADEDALSDLRVGRAAEWELSVALNPETFSEDNPDAPFSDNAELRTFLTYDSEFDAEITVSSEHADSEGVPAFVDAVPDASLAEGTEQVGIYEVDSEDEVEITVSVVPGASLGENQEIDLMFSIMATGEFIEPPEDEDDDEGEEDADIDDPWLEIVPIPGDEDDEDTEPTQEPTAEPTAEPTETETAEPTATPTETPTETASPTQSPDPTEPTETQEPTEQASATPPQDDAAEGSDGHTAAPDEDTADAGDENTESAEGTDDTVSDDTAVSSDDEILPPAIADGGDFSAANSSTGGDSPAGAERNTAESNTAQGGAAQSSAAPVEIASGFFNEFSQNVVSIVMFFAGLLALVGALALRRKEIGAL